MSEIRKCGLFGGYARVTFMDITDIVNEEIKIHKLSPLAAAALGRSMTMGTYICTNLKSKDDVFSVTVNGNGPLGPIVVAGGNDKIRGYVTEPCAELPLKANGHLDVGGGVGTDGFITVVKDLGLKEPYVGRSELVTGEIAEDFVKYLLVSEGIRSAAAFGVKVNADGCIAAGGIVAEALPGITEDMLVVLEDVMSNFVSFSDELEKRSLKEIYDFYFSHLDAEEYADGEIKLACNCSQERIDGMLRGFGREECEEIIKERGNIEVVCHFCEKRYVFEQKDLVRLWDK